MCPDHQSGRQQRGMGLIAAIALLVFVALFAASTLRTAQVSAESRGVQALGLRAFLAAESGGQIALNRIFPPAGGGSCGPVAVDLSPFGMNGCSAAVSCNLISHDGTSYYLLQSSGTCVAGSESVTRVIEVGASQ